MLILLPDYFTNINGKLLPAMVDRKLIEMIPYLLGTDHVHLDASMLLIYYCILWQGLFFKKAESPENLNKHYARQIFICCRRTIPVWQEEAVGTVTDFIAAMYMVTDAPSPIPNTPTCCYPLPNQHCKNKDSDGH